MQLAEYVKKSGYSQASIARALGVKAARVNQWVRGISRPKPELALRLEVVTGGRVTAEEAIGLGRRRPIRIRK
jgi:DNA-binding transcriptional regulator YdaS (Cro superfamily)